MVPLKNLSFEGATATVVSSNSDPAACQSSSEVRQAVGASTSRTASHSNGSTRYNVHQLEGAPCKRWKIQAFENAFVVEPNLSIYKRDIDEMSEKVPEFRGLDDGPPQLVMYRNSEDIAEIPHASHCISVSSSFGKLQTTVHCDAILGIMHLKSTRFLVIVTESTLIASFPTDLTPTVSSVGKSTPAEGLQIALSMFPEYRHIWCISKAILLPFHVPSDIFLTSLPPSETVAMSPIASPMMMPTQKGGRRISTPNIMANGGGGRRQSRSIGAGGDSTGTTSPRNQNFRSVEGRLAPPSREGRPSVVDTSDDRYLPTASGSISSPQLSDVSQSQRILRGMDANTLRYVVGVEKLLSSRGFYFSYDVDLSRSLQAKTLIYNQTGLLDVSQHVPVWHSLYMKKLSHVPLLRYADEMFVWNSQLCKPFQEVDADMNWLVPCIQGSISSSVVNVPNVLVRLFLLCRRSALRGGMRYIHRGIDDTGSVANFCESEFLLSLTKRVDHLDVFPMHSLNQQGGGWVSFVQVRGSVPLFWEQTGFSLNPVPKVTRTKEFTVKAFTAHQCQLHRKYGLIYYINLLSGAKNGEAKLTYSLNELLRYQHDDERGGVSSNAGATQLSQSVYSTVADYQVRLAACPACDTCSPHKTNHLHWDFAQQIKAKNFEAALRDFSETNEIMKAQSLIGYYSQISSASPTAPGSPTTALQKGVLRTNCMDCLDRTNATQWWFAWLWVCRVVKDRGFSESMNLVGEKLDQDEAEQLFSTFLLNNTGALWLPLDTLLPNSGDSSPQYSKRAVTPPSSESMKRQVQDATEMRNRLQDLRRKRSSSSNDLNLEDLSLSNLSDQDAFIVGPLRLPPPFPNNAVAVNLCILPEGTDSAELRSYLLTPLNDDMVMAFYRMKSGLSISHTRLSQQLGARKKRSSASLNAQQPEPLSAGNVLDEGRPTTAAWGAEGFISCNDETLRRRSVERKSGTDLASSSSEALETLDDSDQDYKRDILKDIVLSMWADHGDLISLEYTGICSVMTPLMKAGKQSLYTNITHFSRTVGRYVQNVVEDKFRQECIELFLNTHKFSRPYTTKQPTLSHHTYPLKGKGGVPPASSHFGTPGSLDRRVSLNEHTFETPGTTFSAMACISPGGPELQTVRRAKSPRVWVGTWNLGGGTKPLIDGFHEWFFSCLSSVNDEAKNAASNRSPSGLAESVADIFVICLQEIVDLSSYKTWLLQSDKEILNLIAKAITTSLGPCYINLASDTVVGMHISIFMKLSLAKFVTQIETSELKLTQIGNKGAILIRFNLGETSICFGNVHLTAGATGAKAEDRKAQLKAITESMLPLCKMGPCDHNYCILAGDFNFRTDADVNQIESWLMSGAFDDFFRRDQFAAAKREQTYPFSVYNETRVAFWPTYKYKKDTSQYDRSRAPGWCDRVLYAGTMIGSAHSDEKAGLVAIKYDRVRKCFSSDHKPVYLLVKLRCYFEKPVSPVMRVGADNLRRATDTPSPPEVPGSTAQADSLGDQLIDLDQPDFIPSTSRVP